MLTLEARPHDCVRKRTVAHVQRRERSCLPLFHSQVELKYLRSALSRSTAGSFPPSSSVTGVSSLVAACATSFPIGSDPIKVI